MNAEQSMPRAPLGRNAQRLGSLLTALALWVVLTHQLALRVLLPLFGSGFSFEGAVLSVLAVALLLPSFAMVVVHRRWKKGERLLLLDALNLGVQRYVLGVMMVIYGLPKVVGGFFDYELFALDMPMSQASEFQLSWYFYGKNPWQELFAGLMELVPGLMLLHRRSYYLGALILLPVTGQVFVLNFFFKISGVTFIFATVLLLCNLYVLYTEKERIMAFVRSLDFSWRVPVSATQERFLSVLRLLVFAFVAWKVGRVAYAQVAPSSRSVQNQQLVGVYTLESMQKNGADFRPTKEARYYQDLYFEKQSRWNRLRCFDGQVKAFVWTQDESGRGFSLRFNHGGVGDRPRKIDKASELKGTYQLKGELLTLEGTQKGDTLRLLYKRRGPKPKRWLW